MPVQDVGTLNSIFKTTPILGFPFSQEVVVRGLVSDGRRELVVGTSIIYMDLTQKKSIKEEKRVTFVKPKGELQKAVKNISELPKLYKILKPVEFMIYSAIKEVGQVDGIEELARNISVTNKTIIANLPRLVSLGLVKKQYVACEGKAGSFNKLTVDASVVL
jgi:predicted DNA-binding transcriptional regulator